MSYGITSGRTEPCRDNIGGIKNVYFFPFTSYDHTEIVRSGAEVTNFPATEVFKYEVRNGNFTETINNDEEGISYDQSLTFDMFKKDLTTTNELNTLRNIDFRYIVEYWAGYYKIGGLYSGGRVTSMDLPTGGAKNDLNGYNVTVTSKEEHQSSFIDIDLFTINGVVYNFIFEDGNNFVFEDGNNFTFE